MKKTYAIVLLFFLLFSCRSDEMDLDNEVVMQVTNPITGLSVNGFYLLNEGNMGMNRASIDFFNYTTGNYHQDIYQTRNPSQVKELGDVGNDIQIYGDKLYALINVSNYLEVMDLYGYHIKGIDIPNCRYIAFKGKKAYISSYATPVSIDPDAGRGMIFELDINTLTLTRSVEVGYQPEEMVIKDNKLYVANSGGYRVPHYDRTVSVVDLESFKEIKKIDVGINLHRMKMDPRGNIYVSSRGDYISVEPNLYVIDTKTDKTIKKLDIPVSEMCMSGDSLYFYSVAFKHSTGENTITYGIYDTNKEVVVNDKIITDGTDKQIMIPYGLNIHPETKEIFITDAQNYVVSGYLYCFSAKGEMKWRVLAGNIPAHIAFLPSNLK